MSTYTKQLYSPLAVQPQTIAVPHVRVQQVTSWTTPQKTTLCRRQEPAEDDVPSAFSY